MNQLLMPTLMQRNMCYHYFHSTNEETEAQWDYVACPIYIARGCRSRTKSLSTWLIWQLSGKESACNAGHAGLIPRSERYPGGGNGDPLQYSCLENSMNRGAWLAAVHRFAESDMTELTHTHTHAHTMTLNTVYCELILIVTMQVQKRILMYCHDITQTIRL